MESLKHVEDQAHSGLGADNSRLFTGRGWGVGNQVPRNQNLNSFKALAHAPDQTLPSLPLGKDTELGSLCPFSRALRKPWIGLASYRLGYSTVAKGNVNKQLKKKKFALMH